MATRWLDGNKVAIRLLRVNEVAKVAIRWLGVS
jgi:hypothetical protein